MVLVLAALTSTAFGTGVIVGLAIGGSTAACASTLVERLVGSGRKRGHQDPDRRRRKNSPGGLAGRRPSPPYSRRNDGSPNSVGIAMTLWPAGFPPARSGLAFWR